MSAIPSVMYILYGYIEGIGSYVTENVLYPLRTGEERTLDIVPGWKELGSSGIPRGIWVVENTPKLRRPYKIVASSNRFVKTAKNC
jgi:hypothetical protein